MLNWILIVLVLAIGGYFLFVLFGISILSGELLLPQAIATIILMTSLIYLFSSDLRENYELTHPPKQQINYYELESGQLLMIKGKQ